MMITQSSDTPWYTRFVMKLASYSTVGVSTFLLDLALIALFVFAVDMTQPLAIGIAFFIAVHANYLTLRYWVYRDSPEKIGRTYIYFMVFAIAFSFAIPPVVLWITDLLGTNILLSRILIAGIIGFLSFLFNTFFNFRFL